MAVCSFSGTRCLRAPINPLFIQAPQSSTYFWLRLLMFHPRNVVLTWTEMMNLKNHPACRPFTEAGNLSQISAYYEEGRNIMWMMMRAHPRPCFSQELVTDIITLARCARESRLPFDFWVTGSLVPT